MKKLTLITVGTVMAFLCAMAQKPKLAIEVFKKDTSFSCLASDSNGYVYAGTFGRRIHQYKNGVWKKFSYGLNGLISWQRTSIRQMVVRNNTLWVAHSGFIFNNLGDVDYYRYGGIESINLLSGPGDRRNFRGQRVINVDLSIAGPNTRNTLGVFADTNGRVWSASAYADSVAYPPEFNYNSRYWYKTGGVGIKQPGAANFFRNEDSYPSPHGIGVGTGASGSESLSIGKRKSSTAITPDSSEILIGCDGYQAAGNVLFTPGIMRYNRNTGAYIGKYDQTNTPIAFGATNTTAGPIAMYTDVKGQVWIALSGGRLVRKDTSGWRNIGVPSVLPVGSSVQMHAISGDKRGKIYIGTSNGLLVYNAVDTIAYADSLFYFYTMADGLPSNLVRATHVDKFGTIWLGTANGVCRVGAGDLQMFNLKPTQAGVYITNNDAKRRFVTGFDPQPTAVDTARVAADGTSATLFKWLGRDPQKMAIRIKENNGSNSADVGSFTEVARTADSLVYTYNHPKALTGSYVLPGQRVVTIQISDTTTMPPTIVQESNVTIVRPPVLMLHGIWSSGEAFHPLRDYLINNAAYRSFMISTPSYKNDVSYIENRLVGHNEAEKLLNDCSYFGMSAGKVDVITHSMGGPLARISLQSAEYTHTYHKLITLNAPHSGTQNSEFALTNPVIQVLFSGIYAFTGNNNPFGGGLKDLGVESNGTRNLLNAPGLLNANKVPSHAIASDFKLFQTGQFTTFDLLFSSAVVYKPIFIIKMAIFLGSNCNVLETIHDCLRNKIYKDIHDLNVPVNSQKGGLPNNAVTFFDDIWHNGTIAPGAATFSWVKYLLQERADANVFATNGFAPPTLTYEGPFGLRETNNTDSVVINSPADGSTFAAGQTINVQVTGSANINQLLLITGNDALGGAYVDTMRQTATFAYQIPQQAIGRVAIAILGKDTATQKSVYDLHYINVTPPAGVTLDSIRVMNKTGLKVERQDSLQLSIKGYYSDMVRDISFVQGMTYVFDDVNAKASSVVPNKVIGLVEGFDQFVVTYNGKSDTGFVEIVERTTVSPFVIPVKLTSFTGKLTGNTVQLNWATAQELNNAGFEIERSADGVRFEKIGAMPALSANNGGSQYQFFDPGYRAGANFYRLKQLDIDGRFTYSTVVLVRIAQKEEPRILLYPNPAAQLVNVNVSEGKHPQWQLKITTLQGTTLLTKTLPADQNNLMVQLPGMAAGLYLVVVSDAAQGNLPVYKGKLIVR